MIDGRRTGPWQLDQLSEAGVTPQTYVWCKGMDDWKQAAEVADICRFYRQRLAGVPLDTDVSPKAASPEAPQSQAEPGMQDWRQAPLPEFEADLSKPPVSMLVPAILATLFCFPVTGFMALYYAVATRRLWAAADMPEIKTTPGRSDDLKREAYDMSRNARMWTGITFFLGLILWAFVFRYA